MIDAKAHGTVAARISDAGFRARFVDVPGIVRAWASDFVDLGSANVLDFGCGEGIAAVGMMYRGNAATITGVDIMPDVENCLSRCRVELGIESLPDGVSLRRIEPGADFCVGSRFDLIYSWSVFEHVEQQLVLQTLMRLREKLTPGGVLFLQIEPLFFSSEGSHLFHKVPLRWGHLLCQESIYHRMLHEACSSPAEVDSLWSCYQWLNRMTVPELRRQLEVAGFRVLRIRETREGEIPPRELIEVHNLDVLLTKQVKILARSG